MRALADLINTTEPALGLLRDWIAEAAVPCDLLPPSPRGDEVLLGLQISTRSPLGALAHDTGGLIVDGGWLRFLGSGHPQLSRDLLRWNEGRSSGFFLVADDAAGGFFALNGGAFGDDLRKIYYWPPDSLEWESLGMGFTEFLQSCLTARLASFYQSLRWSTWRDDVQGLSGDSCYGFYPFLWTTEGSVEGSHRALVPVAEAFDLKVDVVRQLAANGV